MERRFTKNDEGFICINCEERVDKLGYTSRNHCPVCLCSLHVDNNPGDRANECGGILRPVSVFLDAKKGYVIIFRCEKCGEIRRNKAARDDNMDEIIRLSGMQY